MPPAPASPDAPDPLRDALLLRVLSALLREDVAGLRSGGVVEDGWLALAAPDGDALLLPVAPDGYQGDLAARLPLLRRRSGGPDLTGCDAVLAALRECADPRDRAGFDAFAVECRQTLETVRLHAVQQPLTQRLLAQTYGPDAGRWCGHRGAVAHDALAAFADHPVYPTARGRAGLAAQELRSYAPEFHPAYRPRWIALPRAAVTGTGVEHDQHWPQPGQLGLTGLDRSHVALPVHPLTGDGELADALRAVGLERDAVRAPQPYLDLVPTLSMRTGSLTVDPTRQLKLPLVTATLGLRNRRTIKPGTLVDGAAGQRLLERVLDREPRFAGRILLADETRWMHAGHELLAALLRVLPAGLDDAAVVPLAALLAEAPPPPGPAGHELPRGEGVLVIDLLARRFFGGDPLALLDAMLALLFDWQVTLFGYGIALESHQQNVSLVLDRPDGGPVRVRLLLKDNDGPRVDAVRLRDTLGGDPPAFDDPRTFTDGDRPVCDVFTTITVHLCAASYAFGLARTGRAPLSDGLALVRGRLAEAIDRLDPGPRERLRRLVLDADRLPVKAMVTAGTLLTKERSGAADINKHYTDGPNYLLHARSSR
ncbi:IucA/IucC family protein [Streptantibioticus silvisoli]|uniref:IucA/IucC family protein n=1 Tax=Streptantibioticus silvisoli TaxID=2705255 RepID=A0ABT6WAM6_9ACTN|nr:IucA/IucC family protein [Streptantibioticus silvisoli]MDI5967532.1 IucA/IucC family protein [Streptantibioticus silvisoli]